MRIRTCLAGGALALIALPMAGPAPATAQETGMHRMRAEEIVAEWPETAHMAANAMLEKYGAPDEMTPTRLIWHDNGPWKRTIVYRDEVTHRFPMPHNDVLEQFINYDVPAEAFDELARYDGSVIAERTKGEISARCDKEAANFLALNLAHGIVNGEYTVEEARRTYAEQIKAMKNGQPAPLTEGFTFDVPQQDINNPDEPSPLLTGMR